VEWLEDSEWANSNLRSSDVIKIIALHLEAEHKLAEAQGVSEIEGDWEEDEVDEGSSSLVAEVEREAEIRRLAQDEPEPEEDLL
jgi:hypothetical protein